MNPSGSSPGRQQRHVHLEPLLRPAAATTARPRPVRPRPGRSSAPPSTANRRSRCACCAVSAVPHEATTGSDAGLERLREVEVALHQHRVAQARGCRPSSGSARRASGPSSRSASRASSGTSAAGRPPSPARRTPPPSRCPGRSGSSAGRGTGRRPAPSSRCTTRPLRTSSGSSNPCFSSQAFSAFARRQRVAEAEPLDRLARDAARRQLLPRPRARRRRPAARGTSAAATSWTLSSVSRSPRVAAVLAAGRLGHRHPELAAPAAAPRPGTRPSPAARRT